MKRLWFLLLLASSAFGQVFSDIATQRQPGDWMKAIPGALIFVCPATASDSDCLGGLQKSQLYTDQGLTTKSTVNPIQADANGNYTFFITPFVYKQCVVGNGQSFCQLIQVPDATGGGGPTITCNSFSAVGAMANWSSSTNIRCDNLFYTDNAGNFVAQSGQFTGPHNGEVWLTTVGTISPQTVSAHSIALLAPNVVPTPYRINFPSAPAPNDGMVLQQLSHSTDASGTYNSFLDWLTPGSGGGGAANFIWEVPSGTVNGSNVTFTLSQTPNPSSTLMLYRNGQLQKAAGTDFTLSGSTITYVAAPITSDLLFAQYTVGPAILNNTAMVQTCTNKFLQAVDASATASNCQTVTSAAMDNTGVTAASYTNANITVDAKGRVTAASNGSAGSAMVQLETHTATAGVTSELDFTTCISSTYKHYVLQSTTSIIPGTNSVNFLMRFSTNGGSSYDNSAIYTWTGSRSNSGGAAFEGTANDTSLKISNGGGLDNTASIGMIGTWDIYDPMSTANYKRVRGKMNSSDGGGFFELGDIAAEYKSTTAANAFNVFVSSGTFAGTMTCYGVTP